MVQKFPTRLVNTTICGCCYKPLSSSNRLISLFAKIGTPKMSEFRILIIPELRVLALTKRHVDSEDEIGIHRFDNFSADSKASPEPTII